MSVYTNINEEELENHLNQYSIGSPISLTGISDGIENTWMELENNKKQSVKATICVWSKEDNKNKMWKSWG